MDANSTNTPEPEKKKRSFLDRFKRDKAEPSTSATADAPESHPADASAAPVSGGLFSKMQRALSRTSRGLGDLFLGAKVIDDDLFEELETLLLMADVGIDATSQIIAQLTERSNRAMLKDGAALQAALRDILIARLTPCEQTLHTENAEGPFVMLVVGVNGVGKTTTIGKVSAQQAALGRSVVLAAGDTFRAAAAEQLETWATRSGAELVRGAEGGDPSSVIFDGVQRAAAKGFDLVLGDTAGRLQNKTNLMDELRKVRRIADREPGQVTEVFLVIDATTGQNGLAQAREFTDAAGVTAIVLTKLDGSAKGGIVFAIETEMGIPIKLVGLGETIDDLVPFNPVDFVSGLFAG